jgi:hypothetical protein
MRGNAGPTSPAAHLGFEVGADRCLAGWERITSYFSTLASGSDRLVVQEYGRSTEGRPLILAIISSPANLADLDRLRGIQARLADPRGLAEAEADRLAAEGKTVVLITCGIHATEVGATQMSMELAYDLLTGDDERTAAILDNVILLLIPSLNPDGLDLVVNWYRRTLGTPCEGSTPPELYQKYAGHDNNRDWFMLTQAENRLTVERVHNVWHPMIVYDLHQMGHDGVRFFVPPYIDPFDPNVDPILRQQTTVLGSAMALALIASGRGGVAHHMVFDCFSPSRAYQHYHGGIRILSEAASVKIATPIQLGPNDLKTTRDGLVDPRVSTWNHPLLWPGGRWRLRDIVEYEKIACMAVLSHAARNREDWVTAFHRVARNALERGPYAFIVPAEQRDPATAAEMLQVLEWGMVEIHRAVKPFSAEGVTYPAGTFVVLSAQPYGGFARTLLETQKYPDLRQYPGGPPKPPYDVTAHTLPLQMGVNAFQINHPFEAELERVERVETPPGHILPEPVPIGNNDSIRPRSVAGYLWGPQTNNSARAANRFLSADLDVYRLCYGMETESGQWFAEGTFFVEGGPRLKDSALAIARELSIDLHPVSEAPLACLWRIGRRRLGVYKSYIPNADEGWTRFVLENYEFPYTSLVNADVKAGRLNERLDAIILPSMPANAIAEGLTAGYPLEYLGGLGEQGRVALREFVEGGGLLIALGQATSWAISRLHLPVRNVLAGLKPEEFYLPGAILGVTVDSSHPVGYGLPRELPVLMVQSPVFDAIEGDVIARFPPNDSLLSGWILGAAKLHDHAAVVEVRAGLGGVILIGPRPQFRAQSRGAYRLLFNSIFYGFSECGEECSEE